MAAQTLSLSDAFTGPAITVYGNPIGGVAFGQEHALTAGMLRPAEVSGLARIRAFRLGSGNCVNLPIPTLMAVYGPGEELASPECHFQPGEVKKWNFPFGAKTVSLEPSQGNVEDLLEALAGRGIDGGLTFENPRYENGKLCVDVHIWAKISVLGASAKFDERIPICINVGSPCVTVWEIGFASLQICYRAPNQICGKLCVGKFGIEKCWEKCVAIPFAAQAMLQAESHPCTCAAKQEELAPFARARAECVTVTIENGKACLNVPIYGSVCVGIPDSIPNGTVAEACIDVCKKFGVVCGVEVYVKVAGNTVASKSWGCC